MPASLYKTAEEFQAKCDEYFNECDNVMTLRDGVEVKDPDPYLKSGLALHLCITTNTLLVHSKDKESIHYSIIKRCYDKIQNDLEKRSIKNGKQAVGCLFNLKCNFGMVETSKLDITAEVGLEAKIRAEVESDLLGSNLDGISSSSHAEDILKK